MNKQEDALLKLCRYYKGDKDCESTDKDIETLCNVERMWVERMKTEDSDFDELLDEYITLGLTSFSETDDVPVTLKALLFNRFTQYNDRIDVEAFKKWYKKHYE